MQKCAPGDAHQVLQGLLKAPATWSVNGATTQMAKHADRQCVISEPVHIVNIHPNRGSKRVCTLKHANGHGYSKLYSECFSISLFGFRWPIEIRLDVFFSE